jgi:hypothetical protein
MTDELNARVDTMDRREFNAFMRMTGASEDAVLTDTLTENVNVANSGLMAYAQPGETMADAADRIIRSEGLNETPQSLWKTPSAKALRAAINAQKQYVVHEATRENRFEREREQFAADEQTETEKTFEAELKQRVGSIADKLQISRDAAAGLLTTEINTRGLEVAMPRTFARQTLAERRVKERFGIK